MSTTTRFSLLAIAAATLGTARGRGALGSVLITLGSELLPPVGPDPERDDRIAARVADRLARATVPSWSYTTNGHRPPL